MDSEKGIILFDGICQYCNSHVNIVLRADKHDRFRVAAIQSAAGQSLIKKHAIDLAQHDSFIFIENDNYTMYTSAAIAVLRKLGGAWGILASLLALVPLSIRDGVYKWIAKNRYRFFGKRWSCRVPTDSEKSKFLPE